MHSNTIRIISLLTCCLVMSAAGSLFTFSVFSDGLRQKLAFSSSDVNVISGVGNTALYLTFLVIGPFYDMYGVRATMGIATVFYTMGYLLMWASYQGYIESRDVVAFSVFYFFAGLGSCAAYMATVGVIFINFPPRMMGLVTGVLLLFYGLSGTIYSQIYSGWYSTDGVGNTGGFLLFLAISVLIVNALGFCFIFVMPYEKTSKVNPAAPKSPTDKSSLLDQDIDKGPSAKYMATENSNADASHSTDDTSMSPLSILKSKYFWLYALVNIWQQGLTYSSNVSTIYAAATNDPLISLDTLAKNGAFQVTLLSIGQSTGRFIFGALGDIIVSHFKTDRTALLVLTEVILGIPIVLLAFFGDALATNGCGLLYICSIVIGIGWGAGGALFPQITKDLFGTKYYGTACAFVMTAVPVGILVSNIIFGTFYDQAMQQQSNTSSIYCYGKSCFEKAFQTALGLQMVPIMLSIALFVERQKEMRTKNQEESIPLSPHVTDQR